MKAVGRNLVIQKIEENITKSKGGLLLNKNDRSDIRYIEAKVISVGEEINGLKENDSIYYDRHAGHSIEIKNKTYQVIDWGFDLNADDGSLQITAQFKETASAVESVLKSRWWGQAEKVKEFEEKFSEKKLDAPPFIPSIHCTTRERHTS